MSQSQPSILQHTHVLFKPCFAKAWLQVMDTITFLQDSQPGLQHLNKGFHSSRNPGLVNSSSKHSQCWSKQTDFNNKCMPIQKETCTSHSIRNFILLPYVPLMTISSLFWTKAKGIHWICKRSMDFSKTLLAMIFTRDPEHTTLLRLVAKDLNAPHPNTQLREFKLK